MSVNRWATHALRSGDLTALRELARSSKQPHGSQLERLRRRGFLTDADDHLPIITVPGRIALMIRRLSPRN